MTCIDLKERFGKRFRVIREPGHGLTRDPWLWQLQCRRGHIAPWGGTRLVACIDGHRLLAKRLASLPGVQLVADGDDGANVVFDVADFATVAKLLKPRRRRVLTPEQRQQASDRLAAFRFDRKPESANEQKNASDVLVGVPIPPSPPEAVFASQNRSGTRGIA
jgi:hypothetical protein